MKGGGGGGAGGGGGKRRWKVLVIGVLVLVILSMLVPLAFLLGIHNGFHSPGKYLFRLISLFSDLCFQIYLTLFLSSGFVTVQPTSPVSIQFFFLFLFLVM